MNEVKRLRSHLRICKIIILILLGIIILNWLPEDVLKDDITPSSNEEFRIEEHKQFQLQQYKENNYENI